MPINEKSSAVENRLEEFRNITVEIEALKGRVRRLISNRHFPTDGEWKESIVRTMLRRYVSTSCSIGRGFVITPNNVSTQIDVMLVKPNSPSLLQDGDLFCVTPDRVQAIVEVKTSTRRREFTDAMTKLGSNIELIRRNPRGYPCKAGLIVLDSSGFTAASFVRLLTEFRRSSPKAQIDYISIGDNLFAHYWDLWPSESGGGWQQYDKWHVYEIEKCAPAYFIINLVQTTAADSFQLYDDLWYPSTGKEIYRYGVVDAL